MKTLRYDYMTAGFKLKDNRHASEVIQELGITYLHGVGQSISDSYEFWGCENVPDNLPESIKVMSWDPMKRIGWGLSGEKAKELSEIYGSK